jgi:arabinose-5-phosphate isomerase
VRKTAYHHLRALAQCRVAAEDKTVRPIFVDLAVPGRRTGAIMLVDSQGKLSGIFTDSDLARLFEHRREDSLDRPIRAVMTAGPLSVQTGTKMIDAVVAMGQRKISELPVVDAGGRPVGLIDITDVVGMFPEMDEHRGARPSEPAYRVFPEPRAG